MAHPLLHAKSSVKKFGGKEEDYIAIHNWFDETKSWIGHSYTTVLPSALEFSSHLPVSVLVRSVA